LVDWCPQLDTRSKILAAEQTRERLGDRPACWVSGHFDPLLAEHVRLLHQWAVPGELLVVEVTNPGKPLLEQRARAELVAALSMVDYVVLANGQPCAGAAADSGLTDRFIQHVLRRHTEEGAG
jgi:bifunctional ADP-heptose synthase (sugar kinase/adenylyltransferase)